MIIALVVVFVGFGLLVLIAVGFIGIYNRLVIFRNRFKNAFSQIDVQLKRRYDLIPNLVETAKTYLKHEKETLEAVTASRQRAFQASQNAQIDPSNAQAVQKLATEESLLGQSLGRLMAVVEAYPELKANETMAQMTEELTSTENKISFARQAYNDSVMEYNTARETFPNSVVAQFFSFKEAALYELENIDERKAPKVSFQ